MKNKSAAKRKTKPKTKTKAQKPKLKVKATPKVKPKPKANLKPKSPSAKNGSALRVGEPVPDFSLQATGGKTVTLSEFRGKQVVIYFYPKDATPGCTLEGQDFSRLKAQFAAAGAEVFGISRDSVTSHEKFKNKENYSIDLLSDSDERACQIFGVIKMKNMYGKQVRGIERSTFVIDSQGNLAKEWRGVKVPGHAEEVLEFVQQLKR